MGVSGKPQPPSNRTVRSIWLTTSFLELLLVSGSILYAGFDITIEPEVGLQTNVPDGQSDSTFDNYVFGAVGIDPSWTTDTGNVVKATIGVPLDALKYIGGIGEMNIAPYLTLEKNSITHVSTAGLSAAYHVLPASNDPTVPEKFFEYSFWCQRQNAGKLSPTGMYAFFILNDIGTSRIDFKNRLQLKIAGDVTSRLRTYVKFGCSWNISNAKGAGYVQPLGTGGVTITLNEKNLLLFQLSAAYSFYQPTNVPVLVAVGRGRWGKKTDTLVSYELSVSRIPFANLYCGFERELTANLNLHMYYMAALFGRGEPHSLVLSHQTGLICSWHRK